MQVFMIDQRNKAGSNDKERTALSITVLTLAGWASFFITWALLAWLEV